MPEGDTIWRLAARLRPALEGRVLERFEAPRLRGDRPRVGDRIEAVEAVGKHLLIRFERGLVLQTHLQMVGRWDLYRTGERWRRPAHLARVRIDVPGWQAVCFQAPTVRTYREGAGPSPIAHLGPDLTGPAPDLALAARRLLTALPPETEIGEALLDQRIAAGVGNVYKSEVLFALGVDPFASVGSIDEPLGLALLQKAHELLRANLTTGARTTVRGGGVDRPRLAVYGRARRPCLRCGTAIRAQRQGAQARVTYWCPSCQRLPEPKADAGSGSS